MVRDISTDLWLCVYNTLGRSSLASYIPVVQYELALEVGMKPGKVLLLAMRCLVSTYYWLNSCGLILPNMVPELQNMYIYFNRKFAFKSVLLATNFQ